LSESETLHVALFRRDLWKERSLLVITGCFEEVLIGKRLYEQRHRISARDGEPALVLNRLMAGAGLAALSLSERETWGWTMTLRGRTCGHFCGVEPEGMICGVSGDAPADRAAAYVQRRKLAGPLVESRYEPEGRDPIAAVIAYFTQVEQTDTLLAVDDAWNCALVQAMPGGNVSDLATLPPGSLIERCRELSTAKSGLMRLNEVLLFYECRCDEEMILNMVTSLPGDQRAQLWEDQDHLLVECPRCGREFSIARRE